MNNHISELVKRGHDATLDLKASCGSVDVRAMAQLISDLATQLNVSHVALTESRREFTAANATIHNLELKVEKVVAENVALKKAAEFATADDMWIEQTDGMLDYRYVDWYADVLRSAMETPVTDAFLAEVRAQGADEVAATCRLLADKDGCSVNMQCSYNLTAERAEAIAAKLRQGAEHE
ncbi:hypothetical protein AB4K05_18395 [Kluyvera sp. STS39-E]|uniref:hypothetical protein n=1 Tax=Kluyvera sp. STS39-E TaxID=3234748 RepID=UPI0034C65E6F